jgi:hypothetical protein
MQVEHNALRFRAAIAALLSSTLPGLVRVALVRARVAQTRYVPAFMLAALLAGCASGPHGQSSGLPQEGAPLTPPTISLFSANEPGQALPAGWREWSLAKFKRPTAYKLVNDQGKTVVRASADRSASGLIHPLSLDTREYRNITWRWKVNELIKAADNTDRAREDSPVRVVVTFAGDNGTLPFGDRLFANQVKAVTGQELPYATLMYIWENRAPKETLIPNRHTTRIVMLVAESGRDKLGTWQLEMRDIVADYKRAFGIEKDEDVPRIAGIGIMTDTDNTGENIHAYYGDIMLGKAK